MAGSAFLDFWYHGMVYGYCSVLSNLGNYGGCFWSFTNGCGVIPVGALAALWTGQTALFGQILLWSTVTLLVRTTGNRILLKHQADQTRNAFFNSFYFFRPGSQGYSFRQSPKEETIIDEDTIDAEYEVVEPSKKEIDHTDPS